MSFRRLRLPLVLALSTAPLACSDAAPSASDDDVLAQSLECIDDVLRATVRRTDYGVAHVQADSLRGAGFGQGFAAGEDQVCVIEEQMLKVRSERAAYFGPAYAETDLALAALGLQPAAERAWAQAKPEVRALVEGYVAGFNRALRDANGKLPAECAGQPWVQPLRAQDVVAYAIELGLMPYRWVYPYLVRAATRIEDAPASSSAPTAIEPAPDPATIVAPGSNGWAIGGAASANGRGILLANPHFPLEGELRFHEVHLRVPGQLDVYGASLAGVPGVLIGFNERVAWTETVSTSAQAAVYRLARDPSDATHYRFDGGLRDFAYKNVSIRVKDGATTRTETFRFERSHQGLVVENPFAAPIANTAYAFRTTALESTALYEHFLRFAQAKSVDDIRAAQESHGVPWANIMATDAAGDALYIDASRVPNLPPRALAALEQLRDRPEVASLLAYKLIPLDGTTSESDWVANDRGQNVVAASQAPQLRRRDFVFNANDSFWLTNPKELLGGSILYGRTQVAPSARTQSNARLLQRGPNGEGGGWTARAVEDALLHGYSAATEPLRSQLVARCRAVKDVTAACTTLAAWDGTLRVGSPGGALYRAFLETARDAYVDGFRADAPLDGERTLLPALGGVDRALEGLGRAASIIEGAGLPLAATLGDVQALVRNGQLVPFPGCSPLEGCLNVAAPQGGLLSTALPMPQGAAPTWSRPMATVGRQIRFGTSFAMVVAFGPRGPSARAILTSGQSADVTSPWFADQANVYAGETLRPVYFGAAQVVGATRAVRTLVEARTARE